LQHEGVPSAQGEPTPRHRPSLDIEREIVEDPRFARIPSMPLAASQMGMMQFMMPNGMPVNLPMKAPDGTMQLFPPGFGMPPGQPTYTMGPNGVPMMTMNPGQIPADAAFLRTMPAPIGGIVDANGNLVNPPTLPYGAPTVLYTPTLHQHPGAAGPGSLNQSNQLGQPLSNEVKSQGMTGATSSDTDKLKALSERESGCTRACRSCGFSKDTTTRTGQPAQESSGCIVS